jgi:hypothetical protein
MKKTIFCVGIVAAVHLLLTWLSTGISSAQGIVESLWPSPETFLSRTASHLAAVLVQPVQSAIDALPTVTPHTPSMFDEALGWVMYALNSILWATAIYWISRKLSRVARKHTRVPNKASETTSGFARSAQPELPQR